MATQNVTDLPYCHDEYKGTDCTAHAVWAKKLHVHYVRIVPSVYANRFASKTLLILKFWAVSYIEKVRSLYTRVQRYCVLPQMMSLKIHVPSRCVVSCFVAAISSADQHEIRRRNVGSNRMRCGAVL